MSKYRQHVTRLVNCPKPDFQGLNNQNIEVSPQWGEGWLACCLTNETLEQRLADRTEKVCEMAAVMKEAVKMDEENTNLQQEVMARLITKNKVGFTVYSHIDIKNI